MLIDKHEDENDENGQFPILDNKYYLLKKIGSGATCKVKLAKEIETGELCAVKILNKQQGKSINQHHVQEIEMLKIVNHPNIINLKAGNKGNLKKPDGSSKVVDYIVLEYASNGELFDYIYFPKKGFPEKIARVIFKQLIDGLDGCFRNGVVHRDLKTENIMLNDKWILKIADFGYATLLEGKLGTGFLHTFLGTLSYASPEILSKQSYRGPFSDLFSCGVILFVLVTGKLPFGKAVIYDAYYKHFCKNDYESFWNLMLPKIGEVSKEFISLINLMLAYVPSTRPNISEIRAHPWMSGESITYEEYFTEFEKRKEIVTKMKEIEAKEEQLKKNQKPNVNAVYRGEELNSGSSLYFNEQIKVKDWVDSKNLFSPYQIKLNGNDYFAHLQLVVNYFEQNLEGVKRKIIPNDKYAKITVKYQQLEIEDLQGLEVEDLTFDVSLLKIDDNSYMLEFIKVAGDKFEFFNAFDDFVSYAQIQK